MSNHSTAVTADSHLDPSTSTGIPNKKLLLWAFLASDCMFFGCLISTHLIYRLHPAPDNIDPTKVFNLWLTSGSTFVLLMSSLMMALAVNFIQKGRIVAMRWALAVTIFFGLIFLGCQFYEFHNFVYEHGMTITGSIFGTTFFTLTGTHGIHVLIGVIWLTSMLIYSFSDRFSKADAIDIESMGLYWHFVDIVWIVIFTVVYLLEFVR